MSIWLKTLIIFAAAIVITIVVLAVMLAKAGSGQRRLCTACKHCKKKLIKLPGGKGRGYYVSTYCYLLQKELKPDSRCVVPDSKKAMYESDI